MLQFHKSGWDQRLVEKSQQSLDSSDCVCLYVYEYAIFWQPFHLPILNSLLAIRISALGMMGGGKQNCSL